MKPPMHILDTFPWANQNILLKIMDYCLCDFFWSTWIKVSIFWEHLDKSWRNLDK